MDSYDAMRLFDNLDEGWLFWRRYEKMRRANFLEGIKNTIDTIIGAILVVGCISFIFESKFDIVVSIVIFIGFVSFLTIISTILDEIISKRKYCEMVIERLETLYPEHACDGEQFDDGYGTAIHDCIEEVKRLKDEE